MGLQLQKNDELPVTKGEVAEIVKEELSTHPEILDEAIESHINNKRQEFQQAEEKRIDESIASNKNALLDDANDPKYGQSTAANVIVNFYDYNCSYCKTMSDVIKKLIVSTALF